MNVLKTKNLKLEMIERILNTLDRNNKLKITGDDLMGYRPNLYLFSNPAMPFIITNIYFKGDVLNIDIKSNDDFYNYYNKPILETIEISHKEECYRLKSDLKYLLSIKALRSLEGILYTNHIRYESTLY